MWVLSGAVFGAIVNSSSSTCRGDAMQPLLPVCLVLAQVPYGGELALICLVVLILLGGRSLSRFSRLPRKDDTEAFRLAAELERQRAKFLLEIDEAAHAAGASLGGNPRQARGAGIDTRQPDRRALPTRCVPEARPARTCPQATSSPRLAAALASDPARLGSLVGGAVRAQAERLRAGETPESGCIPQRA